MIKNEYQLKDVGGLLVESIIELQKLQVEVNGVDDERHSIGVAINEVEHKLHIVSNLLENEKEMKVIKFMPIRNIFWDNHGHPTLVFRKGKVYQGELHGSGEITATTPYYDVDDYINESDIEILD